MFWSVFFPLCADGWWLPWDQPFSSHTHTHTHTETQWNKPTDRQTALTRVLPEETLGAPKVLPDQRWISFEIIHKHFIESLWPVDSVHYVRIWRGRGQTHTHKQRSELNGDNGNHSGHHYQVSGWPLSLIDPPEGDTKPVTKSSPPLLLLDEPPFVPWTESYGESIIATQKRPRPYTGWGDTLRYKTRSEWTASIWQTAFPSALSPVSSRGLQLLSVYVWTVIDPPNSTSPSGSYHSSLSLPFIGSINAHAVQAKLSPLLYMLVGTCTTLRLRLTDRLLKWSLGSRRNCPPSSTLLPCSSTSLISTALKYSYCGEQWTWQMLTAACRDVNVQSWTLLFFYHKAEIAMLMWILKDRFVFLWDKPSLKQYKYVYMWEKIHRPHS